MLHEHPINEKWNIINTAWLEISRVIPWYIADLIRMGINFPVQSYGYNDRNLSIPALNIFSQIGNSDA